MDGSYQMNEIIRYYRYEYPVLSISDCVASEIMIDDNTVVFKFDNNGFWIKNNDDDCYHRTRKSILTLYDCDIENIDIFLLTEINILGEKRRVKEYLEFEEFVDNINKKTMSFEIIQEYKSDVGSLLVGRIRNKTMKADCYLQIDYKKLGFTYDE